MYRYYLALRYLLSRPINLLGMIGVTLGVWALIMVVSIFSGFLKVFRSHVQSATSDVSVLGVPLSTGYDVFARVVETDPNVKASAPRMVWYALVHGKRSQRLASKSMTPGADIPLVTLLGIDPQREVEVTGLRDWLAAIDPETDPDLRVRNIDNPLAPIGGLPAILLGRDRMLMHGLRRGDTVRLTTGGRGTGPRQARLAELHGEFAVAGAFATEHMGFDGLHSILAIEDMREFLKIEFGDAASEISVRLEDPSTGEATAIRINTALSEHFQIRYGSRSPAVAVTWQRINANFLQAVDHQRSLMKMVLFVILVVAAFLMYATLSMMVTEKTRDIGILTALGGRPLGVLQVFMFCGLAITTAGIILGVVAGCLSSIYLDAFNTAMRDLFGIDLFPPGVYNLTRVPYELDPLWIAQVCAVALGAGLLVSGLPALRAARHSPLHSLRNE